MDGVCSFSFEDMAMTYSTMTVSRFIRFKLWKNGCEEHEESFYPLSPDVKFTEIVWGVPEDALQTLDSLILWFGFL